VADRTLELRLVSPSATVFEGSVSSVVLPAWDGRVGILPGHAPYIALLGAGVLEADLPGGGSARFFIRRGVVKVEKDQVTVLSEFTAKETPADFRPGDAWLPLDELGEGGDGAPWNPLA
jgi:F-type H+-transporting ATPase subunit epsilon